MQRTVDLLKKHDLLRVIDEEVDIDLEMAHIAYIEVKKEDSKALLFTKPISKRLGIRYNTPVLMNTFCSYEATKLIFTKEPDEVAALIEELLHMKPPKGFAKKIEMFSKLFELRKVFPKRVEFRGACQEKEQKGDNVDLYQFPILKTWDEDGGPFITMGQVYTVSLDGEKQNLGMYRLQVYDKNRLGMHWQIHKDGAHFFHEYKKAGKKMPVSVAIGGDPLYIWCGQAPMPNGMFELLLYGLIKSENPKLVKCITNDIYVPADTDIVIEGFVDPEKSQIEGPFGDHTGYYTLKEPYPVMDVTCITSKEKPIYQATVVGKPPLEDKYMGWATERVFLPLLKTTAPELIDYRMPENGVFHNLILAKMKTMYPGHAKQFMHAFWGVGQMSFVKHAIFVNEDAPDLNDYEKLSDYILDRVSVENILISEGVCDALDHSSDMCCYGGKLGVDCTEKVVSTPKKDIIDDEILFKKVSDISSDITALKQYKTHTNTPITVLKVKKRKSIKELFEELSPIKEHTRLVVFVDDEKNDENNPYMLIWRVANNIDAKRDIFLSDEFMGIDATNKNEIDGFKREWPGDVECNKEILKELQEKNLIQIDREFMDRFYL
ncbi:MAG: menaquinone biosynthesis decarboxylase [Epsilonproteobacteria bacterium]|nr:menaquinone biosynthesis decarboxylase [Campylobacterota bacterium]